jgi:hypothetical protein
LVDLNQFCSIADDRTCCIVHIWLPSGSSLCVSIYLSYIPIGYKVRSTYDSPSCRGLRPGLRASVDLNQFYVIADDRTCCIVHILLPSGSSLSVSIYLSYIPIGCKVRSINIQSKCQRLHLSPLPNIQGAAQLH